MDFTAFDKSIIDDYAEEAKARWGGTAAYKEYEEKTAGQTEEARQDAAAGLMAIFAGFGKLKEKPASDPEVQTQVEALKSYITAHYYTCTNEILAGLGSLYAVSGEFTDNIDRAGGAGTAAFVSNAIVYYCE